MSPHGQVPLARHACADGVFKALPEVLGHEGIDYGVDTGIKVGHEGEGLADVFEVAIVVLFDHTKGDENVVNQTGPPAESK